MTSFTTPTRQARSADRRAPAARSERPRGRAVAVSWAVSRAAAAAAFPDAIARGFGAGEVTIEISAAMDEAGGWAVTARVIDPAAEGAVPVLSLGAERAVGAGWADDPESGLEHLDIPGLLTVSMDRGGRVLYARTTLLERFGLAGGRYEVRS